MDPIEKISGPQIVLAGAGTGKTYTIVEKVKHLINKKIFPPEKIVCITFSNEAANSLLTRIQRFLDTEKMPIVRTFHGFSADLLREQGEKINIKQNFSILDPDETKVILHTNLKVPVGNCARYVSSIGQAKDLGISINKLEDYLNKEIENYNGAELEKRLESLQFEFQTIHLRQDKEKKYLLANEIKNLSDLIKLKRFICSWKAYEKLKKIRNYQDYSDLNNNALELLKTNRNICEQFDYVIVDEFQDTNKVQLELLKCIAEKGNVMVVGDMNQSIYRFRGAYNKNFEEFKEFFNVTKEDIFNLDKSYRSSDKILRTAHKLICNNYSEEKECFEVKSFNNREGEKVEVFELRNAKEEARKIVEIISKEIESGTKPEEICVMFRNHNYSRVIKQSLEFKGIEYCAVSKSSLLKQKSVKAVIDFLSILNKLKQRRRGGEESWWDLIYQQGFSEPDLIKIGKFMKDNRESENISILLLNELTNIGLSDDGRLRAKMLIERIKLMLPSISKNVPELVKEVCNCSGFVSSSGNKESREIILNLNKFYEIAKNHSSIHESDLSTFIHYLGVLKNLGIEIEAARIEDKGVRLMTLHATKGLEFKIVIVSNIAEKRFPMERIPNNCLVPLALSPEFNGEELSKEDMDYHIHEYERKHQLFDERRLCYVAFTRAKEKLFLTYASSYGEKKSFPSKFLYEIKYKENPDITFSLDENEEFVLPKSEIKPSSGFSILSKKDFASMPPIQKESLGEKFVFSPSSLLTFSECQKRFEYKYVFNMPEEKSIHWEAMQMGSFVHYVLEVGVKKGFKEIKEFLDCAAELNLREGFENIDFEDAKHLIKIFFERHKDRYNEKSKTEQKLNSEIEGVKFTGFADRIDFNEKGEIEIIDYKTGKGQVPPKSRNWQMGYYALAAAPLGKVKKITLEMLRHEKPLEFTIDENGNAKAVYSNRMEFNIYKVKEELVETAKKVLHACTTKFKPCPIEKNCEFCNEWVYGL
jgi:DNA helicase II / ATP-dependent DNA helicase PcrA